MAKTILIVDDVPTIRSLAKFALSKGGFNVLEAQDGSVGLSVAKSKNIDLVISALNMPVMGGFELAKALKADPKTQNIPIFILTKDTNPEDAQTGKEIGVKAWIIKPFVPDKLLAAVKKALN
ncbi:response regulator [Silvanigrella paludirubra]|uniref:Response regulator n=1 Tax=Silvanigrella paludirubra TaxID=2499159 RepID=A0A6N6VSI9_9BACT|nr:response regulator [Silvanigrella paludirubra]KAB8038063.1 response regulator [Silvanigrella paludirubra]